MYFTLTPGVIFIALQMSVNKCSYHACHSINYMRGGFALYFSEIRLLLSQAVDLELDSG